MEKEKYYKLGLIAALSAVKETLSMYPKGMSPQHIKDMIDEIDQQLGLKNTEIELMKRA